MSIIIGLGSGRSGTVSLARLIHAQKDSVCFHEINPCCMTWSTTPGTVLSMLREFQDILQGGPRDRITIDLTSPSRTAPVQRMQEMSKVSTIGEIGFYYLSYVELILDHYPEVRFPCLRRDKGETIRSYIKKMQVHDYERSWWQLKRRPPFRNHWVEHTGEEWVHDSVWDKCFPKFDADTLEGAISMYWDSYYSTVESLSKNYQQVEIFELEEINNPSGQEEILRFAGFSEPKFIDVHENRIT